MDVDLANPLLERILIKRLNVQRRVKEDFYVTMEFERKLIFYNQCVMIGHVDANCKRKMGTHNPHTTMMTKGGDNNLLGHKIFEVFNRNWTQYENRLWNSQQHRQPVGGN